MLEASEPHIPSATNQCTVAASAEACQTWNRTLSSLNVYCIICLVLIVRLNSVYWWLPSHGVRGTKGCRKGQHWLGFQKPLCNDTRLISTIQHSVSFSTVSLSCIPWAVFPHCLCVLRSSVRFVASYWLDGKIKGSLLTSVTGLAALSPFGPFTQTMFCEYRWIWVLK